jgi:hypothetical protein
MVKDLPPLVEGILDFDGLKKYVDKFGYSRSIGLFEDGAAIVQNVTYDSKRNVLVGLSAPFGENGLPIMDFHVAESSQSIFQSIKEYSKTNTVQVMIAKPNSSNAACYILGFYFCDNKFTAEDVINRYTAVNIEFLARDLEIFVLDFDGDSKMLKAEKYFANFGEIFTCYGLTLLCSLNPLILCSQDYEHKMKKIKNALFTKILIIGNKLAVIGHLELLVEKIEKTCHGLVKSDLNPYDKMDYK